MNGTIDFAQPQINADERRFLERVFASSPRDAGVGRGPRRSIFTQAPPLPSPLLHPMEESGFLWLQPEPNSRKTSNIEHRTPNGALPHSLFDVRRWMFDVRCSAGWGLNSPLRPQ